MIHGSDLNSTVKSLLKALANLGNGGGRSFLGIGNIEINALGEISLGLLQFLKIFTVNLFQISLYLSAILNGRHHAVNRRSNLTRGLGFLVLHALLTNSRVYLRFITAVGTEGRIQFLDKIFLYLSLDFISMIIRILVGLIIFVLLFVIIFSLGSLLSNGGNTTFNVVEFQLAIFLIPSINQTANTGNKTTGLADVTLVPIMHLIGDAITTVTGLTSLTHPDLHDLHPFVGLAGKLEEESLNALDQSLHRSHNFIENLPGLLSNIVENVLRKDIDGIRIGHDRLSQDLVALNSELAEADSLMHNSSTASSTNLNRIQTNKAHSRNTGLAQIFMIEVLVHCLNHRNSTKHVLIPSLFIRMIDGD